jgi:hypothetical protein
MMQKTLMLVSRLVFMGTILMLAVALYLGGLVSVGWRASVPNVVNDKVNENGIVLASIGSFAGEEDREIKGNVVSDDARPLLISGYLERYKSPLAPYSDLILNLSDTYGFDYYWILAIGQQESNLCMKIPENSFNCWGYGINSAGTLRFENYELALKSFAEYLKREYFDKGLNTPELIMKKYCPHSNGSWAYGVNQFIEEIENGKF